MDLGGEHVPPGVELGLLEQELLIETVRSGDLMLDGRVGVK